MATCVAIRLRLFGGIVSWEADNWTLYRIAVRNQRYACPRSEVVIAIGSVLENKCVIKDELKKVFVWETLEHQRAVQPFQSCIDALSTAVLLFQ